MKYYHLLLFMLLVFTVESRAQLQTYITIDAGPAWDISGIEDGRKIFDRSILFNTGQGIGIWQELIPGLSLGTGAYYHQYFNGINLRDQRPHQGANIAYSAILIPARLSYRIQPMSHVPFGISPLIGYQYGLLLSNTDLQLNGMISTPDGQIISYQGNEVSSGSNSLHLLEAGLIFDYRFPSNWQFSFNLSNLGGLQEFENSDISFDIDGGEAQNANYQHDGSLFQASFSLGIPLSNLWNNSDLRKHRRIEHSSIRTNGIRKKRYLYIGADFGPLWRSFIASSPEVGARPFDGVGIFRYSNLHSGLYLGFKRREETGVDIGAYFQRSSTYISVMADHENDLAIRERAPFFLEFPLQFRYFYQLYYKDFYLVPKVGVSAITHFAGASYAAGSGDFNFDGQDGSLSYTASRNVRLGANVLAGLGLQYELPMDYPLTATAEVSYRHGLRVIDESVASSALLGPDSRSISYSGTGWLFTIGLRKTILLGKENRKCNANIGE